MVKCVYANVLPTTTQGRTMNDLIQELYYMFISEQSKITARDTIGVWGDRYSVRLHKWMRDNYYSMYDDVGRLLYHYGVFDE